MSARCLAPFFTASPGLGLVHRRSTSSWAASRAAAISWPRCSICFGTARRPPARHGSAIYVAFPIVCVCGLAADRRSRPAAALLAHADPVPDVPADVQDLVADVDRRVGAPALQRMRLRVVRRRRWPSAAGRHWATPAPAAARTPGRAARSGAGRILGLYLAGYTGVLLSVTNRPIWADTTLLGLPS